MLLHVNFIPLKFSVILLVIVPPQAKCICSFSYIFIIRNFTFKQIDQALIITIKFMIYLESFTCDSTRKGICFYDISIKYMKMGNLGTLQHTGIFDHVFEITAKLSYTFEDINTLFIMLIDRTEKGKKTLPKRVPHLEFFWSVFPRTWVEYRDSLSLFSWNARKCRTVKL